MCSLVAEYGSDEEADAGWSLRQAAPRDMEISDGEQTTPEATVHPKNLRRKKRIDLVLPPQPPPPPPPQLPEQGPPVETEVPNEPTLEDRRSALSLVKLSPCEFVPTISLILKGQECEVDTEVESKVNECLVYAASGVRQLDADHLAPLLLRLKCLQEAWDAGSLDGHFFCARLDEFLHAMTPSTLQNAVQTSSTSPEPLLPNADGEALPPPPPPPPDEDYPTPPPPPPEADLGAALDSFYSEMAGIEAAQVPPPPAPLEAEVDPEKEEQPLQMVNRNRKGKISSSMGMKRKNVSGLMEKWKKVKEEWDQD